jgi:hypothetical protein
MIISCSRRTDIPAAYSGWLMKRLEAGFCTVANPMNSRQVSRISLKPEDVDIFVFWSKNPAPLMPHLSELDDRGYRYYFLFTLNDYDRTLEPNVPDLADGIDTFLRLSDRIGPGKVVWRYDPIILSQKTDARSHLGQFASIAKALSGRTERVIISIVDFYRKTERAFQELDRHGYAVQRDLSAAGEIEFLIAGMAEAAGRASIEIQSCAEDIDLTPFGVPPGKCIDDALIERVFGMRVTAAKDPAQRPACKCIVSRDIGVYNTCPAGCVYCYANSDHAKAAQAFTSHDETTSSLSS